MCYRTHDSFLPMQLTSMTLSIHAVLIGASVTESDVSPRSTAMLIASFKIEFNHPLSRRNLIIAHENVSRFRWHQSVAVLFVGILKLINKSGGVWNVAGHISLKTC